MKILIFIRLVYFKDHFTTCPKCIWALTVVLVPTFTLRHNITASLLQKLYFIETAGHDCSASKHALQHANEFCNAF